MKKELFEKLKQQDRIEYLLLKQENAWDLRLIYIFVTLGMAGASLIVSLGIYAYLTGDIVGAKDLVDNADILAIVFLIVGFMAMILTFIVAMVSQDKLDSQFLKKLDIKHKENKK